jgi:hypothetical protein
MLCAQRQIEARIGQLLGPAEMGRGDKLKYGHDRTLSLVAEDSRADFRLLGRALAGECEVAVPTEWRKSRGSLRGFS